MVAVAVMAAVALMMVRRSHFIALARFHASQATYPSGPFRMLDRNKVHEVEFWKDAHGRLLFERDLRLIRMRNERCLELSEKYRNAARHPWLPILWPDPPEPVDPNSTRSR